MKTRNLCSLFCVILLSACGSDSATTEEETQSAPKETVAITQEAAPTTPYDSSLTINTAAGQVQGINDNYDTYSFKGIPYAAPPTGDFRWRAPQPVTQWQDTRDASEYGAICPQLGTFWGDTDPNTFGEFIGNEDCLFLNVWRPNNDDGNLPVFFWIHGGSASRGSGSSDTYNGAHLAAEINAVVITINYRLGALGLLYSSTFFNDNKEDSSGNYALLDMVQALKWVNNNITAFGGNLNNVTIAGNSSAANSVWGLLQTPLSEGLFHRALMSSGLFDNTFGGRAEHLSDGVINQHLVNTGNATTVYDAPTVREQLGTSRTAEIMRNLSAEALVRGNFGPMNVVDGYVLPMDALGAVNEGAYHKVPMIMGSTKDEGSYMLGVIAAMFTSKKGASDPLLWQQINSVPETLYAMDVIDFDYSADFVAIHQTYSYMWNRYIDKVMPLFTEHNPSLYRYDFNWDNVPAPWDEAFAATHTMDLPFLFGNFITDKDDFHHFAWTEENQLEREMLSSQFMAYIGKFMRTGNPSDSNDNVQWPVWHDNENSSLPLRITLDATIEASETIHSYEVIQEKLNQLPTASRAIIAQYARFGNLE